MFKLLTIIGALLVLSTGLYAQDEVEDVHAILRKIANSKSDTNRVRLLLHLSELFLPNPEQKQRIKDSALLMAVQAKDLSHRLGYKSGEADAFYQMGQNYIENNQAGALATLLTMVEDTVHIKLMLAVTSHLLQPEKRTPAAMDSAITYCNLSLALSEAIHAVPLKAKSLTLLGSCLAAKGNIVKAKAIWQQAFEWSRRNNYFIGDVDTYEAVAAFCSADTSLLLTLATFYETLLKDEKRIIDKQALAAAQTKLAGSMVQVALRFWDQNDFERTLKQLLLAIEYGKTANRLDVEPYFNIVYVYLYRADFKKALYYSLEGVRIVEMPGSGLPDERPYMNLGKVYSDMQNYPLAMENFNKAASIIKQKGYLVNGSLLRMMAEVDISLNKPAAALPFLLDFLNNVVISDRMDRLFVLESTGYCLSQLERLDEAEKYLLEARALAEKSTAAIDRYNTNEVLGTVYFKKKQWEKSRLFAEQVLEDSATGLEILKRQAHYRLFAIDSAVGNYLSAIQHLNTSVALYTNAFNATKRKEVEDLKMKYETEKKEQDIQLLVKQAQLQEADIRQSRHMRNGLISGAAMLILLLAMLFSRYRIKQKSNYLLEQQKQTIYLNNEHLQHLNTKQQKLIGEKEWLIREVHHRVKNNLQLVMSLLNLQKEYVSEEHALHTFEEIGSRINAISLIHQKLYQVHDLTMISMHDYIRELVSYLKDSYNEKGSVIYDLQIDPIFLDASQSVPIGLILNEAITNSIKYAFPGARQGRVSIQMKQQPDNRIELIVADNGVGLPKNFMWETHDSMGLELIKILSAQLDGDLTMDGQDGVTISLIFNKQTNELVMNDALVNEYQS